VSCENLQTGEIIAIFSYCPHLRISVYTRRREREKEMRRGDRMRDVGEGAREGGGGERHIRRHTRAHSSQSENYKPTAFSL